MHVTSSKQANTRQVSKQQTVVAEKPAVAQTMPADRYVPAKRHETLKGATLGYLAGGVDGAIIGAAIGNKASHEQDPTIAHSMKTGAFVGSLVAGNGGMAAGAVIGHHVGKKKVASLPQERVVLQQPKTEESEAEKLCKRVTIAAGTVVGGVAGGIGGGLSLGPVGAGIGSVVGTANGVIIGNFAAKRICR